MSCIANLLTVAEAYQKATGLDLSTVSWRALGDVRKLSALAGGKDIQVTRFERAMDWFSQNWPSDAQWPESVARPQSSFETLNASPAASCPAKSSPSFSQAAAR